MKARRLAVMVMAALLVSTTLVAPVAASTPDDDDDGTGFAGDPCGRDAIEVAIDVLQLNLDKSTECRIEEIRQGNVDQEMQDIHGEAARLATYSDSFLDGHANSIEHADTVAWTKAEVATLNALENNSTQAETRQAAIAAVNDYYTVLIQNLLADRNAKWDGFEYLDGVVMNESLNRSVFDISYMTTDDRLHHNIGNRTVVTRYDYQLPNGSTFGVYAMRASASGTHIGGGGIGHFNGPMYVGSTLQNTQDYGQETVTSVIIESTYDNDTVIAYNGSEWWNTVDELETQRQQMLDNLNYTVNGLYGSYVRGELDIQDYESTQAAAMDSSQNLRETGWLFYAAHSLAEVGATVPNLSETGSMTISTSEFTSNNSTEELTGLMVGDPPGATNWTVGETYDPANGNGTLRFLVSASNSSVTLTEPFTLVGAEDREGGEVSVVEPQTYQYRTNNYSELGDKLDRLLELRQLEQQEIEEAANGGSGGGIGWPNLGSGAGLALGGGIVMLALAAVLVGIGVKLYIEVMTP